MLNWSTKKLGEIREEIKKEKAPIGAMPYIEIGNVNVESKKVNFTEKGAVKGSIFCPEGSILISRVRPTRGAVVLVNKKYAVSSAFTIIQPKINPRLLFYFLAWNKNFFEYLGNLQKGTSYPSVRESDILDFEVSFPEDKVEQQKIVYILDSIQDAIRTQEKIIEKTKELNKSMMADLFKYGGPSFRKGRKLKKTEIGEIPEDWETIYLSDKKLFELQTGLWAGKKGSLMAVKVIRNTDFEDGKLIFDNVSEIEVEVEQFRKRDLRKDDILIEKSGGGPKQPVGRVAFINNNLPNYSFSNFLSRIRVITDKIFPAFIFRYLDYFYQKGGTFNLQERTTGIRNLRFKDYINQPIPFPSLPEQREIAEILQTIDQKIEIEQKKKALYEELFKTMLNKLMTGEIRVDNLKL